MARILQLSRAGDLAGVLRREGISAAEWDAARLQLATTLAADPSGDARRRFEQAYRQVPGASSPPAAGGTADALAGPAALAPPAGAPGPPAPDVPDVPTQVQVPSFLVADREAAHAASQDLDVTMPPVWRPGPTLPFVAGAASLPAPRPREMSPSAGETVELVDLDERSRELAGDVADGDTTLFLRLPEGTRR